MTKAVFTIVKKLAYSLAMERARADSRVSWRAWAWRLPGLFFLDNPFVSVATSPSQSSTIQHSLSYRATIASSELGCSTLQHSKIHVSPLEALMRQQLLLPQTNVVRREPVDQAVRVVPQDLGANLWFRPPPVQ